MSDRKNVLKKYVRDLTAADIGLLEKPLGVRGRPYPMQKITKDSSGILGVLEDDDNPLVVYSERPYAQVAGMAIREMPTPGMLQMFFDAIIRRRPGSNRLAQYLKGVAGSGKTYMAALIGRMRTEEGSILVNCGDKNIAELLYETVLDFNNDSSFYDALDEKLVKYNEAGSEGARNRILNPLSIATLRKALGGAFSEENGVVSIDWSVVKTDDDGLLSKVLAGLEKVRDMEGLGGGNGNALGMVTQEGPLITAWKEGREIILDEYNKSKEGTDGGMQGILQFLAGEIDETIVENSLKEKGDETSQHFTFRREEQRAGFYVTFTGNSEEDGTSTRELSQSFHSRIPPQPIPVATIADWQHRICQVLTGIPVSTLYRSGEKQWSDDPDGFRIKLLEWRKLGLSKGEVRNIPDIQLQLLQHWEDVLEASARLADFYYAWSALVDPDSVLHQAGKFSEIMAVLDDRYRAEVSIDFRKILDHVKEAMELRPNVKEPEESEGYDTSSWSEPPALSGNRAMEDPAMNFGNRLSLVILNHINKTTANLGKKPLHRQLMTLAVDAGLAEANFKEAQKSNRKTIAELLSNNPFSSAAPSVQAALVRDLVCDYLRVLDPAIEAENDEIMSVEMVRRALDTLKAEDDDMAHNALRDESFLVFNDDLNDALSTPVRRVETVDAVPAAKDAPANEVPADELLPARTLMPSLAAPVLRSHNLKALWNNNALSDSGSVVKGIDEYNDRSLAMAEGESDTGLAITTVMVGGTAKSSTVPVYIVWNMKSDEVLVVGEGAIERSVMDAYVNSRMVYVDRLEEGAERRVKGALFRLLDGADSVDEELLKSAFLLRNMLVSNEADEEARTSLSALLVHGDVQSYLPRYLTNRPVAAPAP